jgi:hypothetical protein
LIGLLDKNVLMRNETLPEVSGPEEDAQDDSDSEETDHHQKALGELVEEEGVDHFAEIVKIESSRDRMTGDQMNDAEVYCANNSKPHEEPTTQTPPEYGFLRTDADGHFVPTRVDWHDPGTSQHRPKPDSSHDVVPESEDATADYDWQSLYMARFGDY